MRLIRFLDEQGNAHYGLENGPQQAEILDFDPAHPLVIGNWLANSLGNDRVGPTESHLGPVVNIARLLPPTVATNIICVGLNYAAHAQESSSKLPEYPMLFMKPTTAVIADGEPICIPKVCEEEVDYECELAVVIGRKGRDIPEADALDYVLGYTIANDVSARIWQKVKGGGQFVRAKSFDTFCPLGPAIIPQTRQAADFMHARTDGHNTPNAICDPQKLQLKTIINDDIRQDSSTSDMIFNVRKLISFISSDTTLMPGTLILTGTPSGVGMGRKPQTWLQPGDRIEMQIECIGKLSNPVEAA